MQEASYHFLLELWVRKVFPGIVYTNANILEKSFKILYSQLEISELPEICLRDS